MICIFKRPPHELFPWEYAMKRKPPQTPGIALGCPRSCFRSVVRSHRPVVRWRQPRSIHLGDEHGCVQLVDAGVETTRRREPRGVSGTLEVSPTGSIPHRKNPARQVANDKVEASRAMLSVGIEAPECVRPRTRVAVQQHKDKQRQEPDPPQPKFAGREGAANGGSMGFLAPGKRGWPPTSAMTHFPSPMTGLGIKLPNNDVSDRSPRVRTP